MGCGVDCSTWKVETELKTSSPHPRGQKSNELEFECEWPFCGSCKATKDTGLNSTQVGESGYERGGKTELVGFKPSFSFVLGKGSEIPF